MTAADPIPHVIMLIMENCSFDHMLESLAETPLDRTQRLLIGLDGVVDVAIERLTKFLDQEKNCEPRKYASNPS